MSKGNKAGLSNNRSSRLLHVALSSGLIEPLEAGSVQEKGCFGQRTLGQGLGFRDVC